MTAPGVYLLAIALSHTILWARGPILLMLTQLTRMRTIYTRYITMYVVIIIYVVNVTLLQLHQEYIIEKKRRVSYCTIVCTNV